MRRMVTWCVYGIVVFAVVAVLFGKALVKYCLNHSNGDFFFGHSIDDGDRVDCDPAWLEHKSFIFDAEGDDSFGDGAFDNSEPHRYESGDRFGNDLPEDGSRLSDDIGQNR